MLVENESEFFFFFLEGRGNRSYFWDLKIS